MIPHLFGEVINNLRGLFWVTIPCVDLTRRVAESPASIADRATAAIGNHVCHLRGILTSIAGVHVLDHLLASSRLDVEVNVGRPVAFRGEEALK